MEPPAKSVQRTRDGQKGRLRFASAKSRAKRASADVYRSSDGGRLAGRSATAAREGRVHGASFQEGGGRAKKRRRKGRKGGEGGGGQEEEAEREVRYFGSDGDAEGLGGIGRTAVIAPAKPELQLQSASAVDEKGPDSMDAAQQDPLAEEDEEEERALLTGGTLFLSELEVSSQRNGARLFQALARQLRPLCKSLAETIHHTERVVDLLLAFMLTPRGEEGGLATPLRTAEEGWKAYQKRLREAAPNGYQVNAATADVLHLLGVLARELREELYPYLHSRILPRIVDDLLNPPTAAQAEGETAVAPLDVSHVEAAFRAMSYLFKYNAERLVHDSGSISDKPGRKSAGDADVLRRYYGTTICHKREVVRRLASEAFAPILRKCPSDGLKRHVGRTVRALAGSLAAVGEDDEGGTSRSAKRARDDAVDGVASLLFEATRGAPGRLHTKTGQSVARALLDALVGGGSPKKTKGGTSETVSGHGLEQAKAQAVYDAASRFLYKVRGHVAKRGGGSTRDDVDMAGSSFADVFDEVHRALASATSLLGEASHSSATPGMAQCVAGHIVDLTTETIQFQEGRLVKDGRTTERVVASLQRLFRRDIYSAAGRDLQDRLLRCLCAAWRANPSHPSFALRLGQFFPSIVAARAGEGGEGLDPALFLAENLLPHLPRKVASAYLTPALLGAAASSSQETDDTDASLRLLHVVATTIWSGENPTSHDVDIDDAAADALFSTEAAEECPEINSRVLGSLFDICLAKEGDIPLSEDGLARLGYVARCVPFLVSLECSSGSGNDSDEEEMLDDSRSDEVLSRVFKWYASTMESLDTKAKDEEERKEAHAAIVQALVLESFATSVAECHRRVSSTKIISQMKKTSGKAKECANSALFLYPKSLWVVRAVAAVASALIEIDPGSKLNDRSNDTHELLVPNLAESNHFLRLYTLKILDSYPARPFVTDHADLDLTDDLEEEPSYRPQPDGEVEELHTTDGPAASSLSGRRCDVMTLLRALESTPVSLPNERKLTTLLGRIEVYARTGKLPIVYAEAITCHMLGLLHVKFAPVWPAAVKVLVSLSSAQEGPSWPYIDAALRRSMERPAAQNIGNDEREVAGDENAMRAHHDLCVAWETSCGKNSTIFGPQNQDRNAQVSRLALADEMTLIESTWSIMENAPLLTSTKSRVVVPIFFEFLVAQYYVFHEDEPDSREIDFASIVESPAMWPREVLGRKALQKKLESFLRMFAAVKGPQQLIKHKVLLHIFVSFLANPDAKLSNLAFACVLRFKLPYLSPYVEHVHPMLKKEGLREALAKFDLSQESETVDAEHRHLLLPIVMRILFGRFSSRGNGAKSSKDSPAARRAAILSFFSGIGNEAGELNYFIYMMVRAFVPRDIDMRNEGVQTEKDDLVRMIHASERISQEELAAVPVKRQEGFLNLLSDVITQIGFGVKHFVPTFMGLLLALCEQSERALAASKDRALPSEAGDHESKSTEVEANSRIGRIRSLSLLRLAHLFTKFASSLDFAEHGERLWSSTYSSVVALPNTVVNAENPPSLLQLIESIASHNQLVPLLCQSDNAVVSVFKCIAGTTRRKVMDTVLRIIDGLLTEGGTMSDTSVSHHKQSPGQELVLKHIHLLIAQFTNRLTNESQIVNLEEDVSHALAKKGPKQKPTDGLQLNILCRVSELLVSAGEANDEHTATMETLCELLVPLLKFDSHPNQLYLLRTVNSLLPKLSVDASRSHFHALSKLLGPKKNQSGIVSHEHRLTIASAIGAICGSEWSRVANAVRDLNAVSTSYVDEHDFEKMLPVLNSLGASGNSEGSWLNLSDASASPEKAMDGTRMLAPLISSCFHLVYDSDGVVSRASNKALRTLVEASSNIAGDQPEDKERNPWVKLIETTVVPCLKTGITTKEVATRRSFVLLLSHIARNFSGCNSAHLYGDLKALIRDDDQDLDFFLNITHVQLHRRARALNRLRKVLSDHKASPDQPSLFSDQSFGNALLPLAMHPVYEYQTKTEEGYVVEAIATVGEISKHLPWSKYNNTLQSVLNNLPRYPEQERFLVAMMCSIIDGFHFSVETGKEENRQSPEGNGVWRTLNNRIIPKVESSLIKEKVDRHGSRVKSLRSSVVLALMKLFQKLPCDTFEAKLSKLVTIVCNALKNKDIDERRVARETLSKMAVALDLKYLPLILSEMSVSLSEGYKLHVRSATLHSILVALSKVYKQPSVEPGRGIAALPFDRCVPAMLDLIHQDIFGKASEIKEVEHVEKRLVKEASGAKGLDSLEIISRMIHFQPSIVTAHVQESLPGLAHASTVHALVTPFLDRLRDPDVSSSTVKKVRECLARVAIGFSNNASSNYDEMLPFVYATIAPFIHGRIVTSGDIDADLDDSEDEIEAPIQVSKSKAGGGAKPKDRDEPSAAVTVVTWMPSNLGNARSQKSALAMKTKQKKALHRVTDGAAAPKLTGSSRHSPLKSSKTKVLNSPANACATAFGLSLLNSSLKRSKLDVSDERLCAMADPYLPLLAHCARYSSDSHAVVQSLRCLGIMLRMDLPSVPKSAKDLAPGILDHLTTSNAASSTQSDFVQSCFKTLTLLISHPKFVSAPAKAVDEKSPSSKDGDTMPLSTDQMQALLSLLHSAVMEYDHHNSTFLLVKAILSKKYMSAELYDLMDIILKLTVQSQKSAVRLQQSSQIFLLYLLEYPMGGQRMEKHLRQIVLNLKYEYEEGRLSAIDLLSSVIQKFPLPVLEGHAQLFFIPLVLQLVNDESKKCKEAVSDCIVLLLQRLSTEYVQTLFGYAQRWSQSPEVEMQKASAQLFGVFVDARPDYIKRGSTATDLVAIVLDDVVKQTEVEDESGWELLYHNLVFAEKLNEQMPSLLAENQEFWGALVQLLAWPHPWVMQVSSRMMSGYVSTIDPIESLQEGSESFIAKVPGCLYTIARNLCRQLDVDDVHFVESTSTLAIKTLSWVFRAMKHHPELCYTDVEQDDLESKDGCLWMMTRLSNIAKPKGRHRRESVFKCFAALCASCSPDHLVPYLELMIDPVDRSIREAANTSRPGHTENDPSVALPKDVLQLIEDTCGTEHFVRACAEVNRKVREKRDKRKQEMAAEAIRDPTIASKRKIQKHLREKDRRKRKVDERKTTRGASKKQRQRH
ncbi:hypothetical protein ACHAXT_004564 [Thalassiosira profunda]